MLLPWKFNAYNKYRPNYSHASVQGINNGVPSVAPVTVERLKALEDELEAVKQENAKLRAALGQAEVLAQLSLRSYDSVGD